MRQLPEPSQYGFWDVLPDDPPEDRLNFADQRVVDALERRDALKRNHAAQSHYPDGFWARPPANQEQSEIAAGWRNFLLRNSWEGISYINGRLIAWSEEARAAV